MTSNSGLLRGISTQANDPAFQRNSVVRIGDWYKNLGGAYPLNEYALIKLLHLGALIFWLGPALGAWLVLKAVTCKASLTDPAVSVVNRVFFHLIIVEHVAFVVLITTGFLMALQYGWFGSPWLTQKLWIVFLLLIPIEIIDVLLGNWIACQASKKFHSGNILKRWEQRALDLYHGAFTKLALVIIPPSVLCVMYLAVSKTGIVL